MNFDALSRSRIFFSLGALLLVAAGSARGQATNADRARLVQSQTQIPTTGIDSNNGVDQNYAAASPNDSDLGEQAILKRVEKAQPFSLETGTPIYYTSNVALTDGHTKDDVIIAPVIGLTYSPKLGKTLYGDFSVRQQFFSYADNTGFNFASFDAIAGAVYLIPKLHNLTLRANVDYNRLTGIDDFDAFFSNVALGLSAELPIPIGRAQQISLGVDGDVSLYATPSPPQRNDFGAYVGYAVNVSRSFALDAAARLVVRPYDSGRTDVSEVIALSANYRVREYLTLSLISTFVANQSNRSGFDYRVFNGGGAVSLTWKF
ncbi:MAG: hypothetical protein H0X40_16840 [Chthoniobacterales bacterium]|nr:hypothetical protein [Chthoniobacterales bacterium]